MGRQDSHPACQGSRRACELALRPAWITDAGTNSIPGQRHNLVHCNECGERERRFLAVARFVKQPKAGCTRLRAADVKVC